MSKEKGALHSSPQAPGKFPYKGDRSNMILADIAIHPSEENGIDYPSKGHRKKHRKKKGLDEDTNGLILNNDSDIVTPYQNGHYLQPPLPNHRGRNGYHYQSSPRLNKSISNEEDLEDADDDNGLLLAQPNYGDFLSPQPSLHNLLLDERGAQSSLSLVNNAITVAPSRNNLNDLNVFAGGRPNNLKRNHRNNRHQKHKGRSRTPDFTNRMRLDQEPKDSQSILNRIDLSIRKNFGDWDGPDEEEMNKKLIANGNGGGNNGKPSKTPYFIPKSVASDSDIGSRDAEVNLPRLFKSYDNVAHTSKQVLHDKSYKIALSRDNADPNSILSQAKKTLSYINGSS